MTKQEYSMNFTNVFSKVLLGLFIGSLAVPGTMSIAAQRRGGGGGAARAGGGGVNRVNMDASRTSIRSTQDINRNVNVNRDVDRNTNRDVNVNRDVDLNRNVNADLNYDRWGHPVARGVAAGLAFGTTVALLPNDCSTTVVNGIAYSHCGSDWYQPYYSGTTVEYVVVSPPQ
jgi:hypothetical protein